MNQEEIMARLMGMEPTPMMTKEEQHEAYLMQKMEEELETTSKGIINPPDVRFYYLRDADNHPYVTVCVGTDTSGIISRGVAICSRNDAINRGEGRKRSYARMQIAQEQGSASRPIAHTENSTVASVMDAHGFDFKAEYDATPTEYERKLLDM